jgi:EAL domain-containing protein (putative c-di-GMP-specific phosphodiesterase class I)/CheY-like chemotaxis protein
MSDAPHRPASAELELYRAVMHRRLAGLRHTAPLLSVPSGVGPDSLTPDVELTAPPADVMIAGPGTTPGHILLVEDEQALARAYTRTLKLHGIEATWVSDATSALGELRMRNYDVIVSDIMLPDHSGLELLRHVRNSDPDLPMVLVTGMPNLDSAIDAVALGAFRYLVKPISNDRLIGCIAQAQRTRQVARLREEALNKTHTFGGAGDAELARAFERALEPLWIAYQPVTYWPDRSIYGYQALVRSDEPSLALPSALLSAAERLGRSQELSRAVRRSVAKTARGLPAGTRVLVNSGASDLLDPDLYAASSPLGAVAARVALDIVDNGALLHIPELESRMRELRGLGYKISVSVSGSSYVDFARFAPLAPDIIKIDATRQEGLSVPAIQRHGLERAAEWCAANERDLIVEGVERDDERNRLIAIGCKLFQDCLFTHPGRKLSRA